MLNQAKPLRIHKFGGSDPLSQLPSTTQTRYLQCYLSDLNAKTVIEEQSYFDRDYLAEFSAFYSISSKGYPNTCRRLHFFADNPVTRDVLRRAAGGSKISIQRLQKTYLGFVVIRPIPAAPLGRTVLKWYSDEYPLTPRIVEPSRVYSTHLAGFTLNVYGLAWQQQDTGVGACATIGLWTMLHSSAFDDHHAIPTTAGITRAAHKTASLGARMFPSTGLQVYQICEAVKEQNLSPVLCEGDLKDSRGTTIGFTKERFASSCAAFIRSGYPVMLIGTINGHGHAICAVGFRSCASEENPGTIGLQDGNANYLYIHDDNLGPNVRFVVEDNGHGNPISIKTNPPPERNTRPHECPTEGMPSFIPMQILVAVHNDLRTSPDTLHKAGITNSLNLLELINAIGITRGRTFGLSVSARFVKLADYLGTELSEILGAAPKVLSKVRMELCENVSPMSLHVGLVRIGLDDSTPLIDFIYDTTDSDRNHPVFANIVYAPLMPHLIEALIAANKGEFGISVNAF